MALRIRGTALLCASALSFSICAQTPAQETMSPELAAQGIAAGLEAQSDGALRTSATGRHVDIEQTIPVPENASPKRMKAGADAVRKLVLDRVCGSSNTRIAMRAGIDLTWTFRDPAGGLITQVHVDKDVCPPDDASHS
jgi:hypothetical protein